MSSFSVELIKNYVIELVRLTQKDIEDFYDNPVDFIRKMKDVTETFYSWKYSALDFINLTSFIKSGSNTEPLVLGELYKHICQSLEEMKSSPPEDYRIKDAFLAVFWHMSSILKQFPSYNDSIEDILIEYGLSGLSSENSIEKYRALSLYFNFSYLSLSKKITIINDQQHLYVVADLIFKLLSDHEIAVKVTAASALYRLIKKPQLKNELESNLGLILCSYFSLMKEIDSEDLVFALKEIVTIFKLTIEPYALQLWLQLEESYWKLYNSDDDENEISNGAITCLSTIKNIFESSASHPELLVKLEQQCRKMFMSTTTQYSISGIDYALDCLAITQFYTKSISDNMLSLVPVFLKITAGTEQEISGGFALEYFAQMEEFFKNIVQFASDQLFELSTDGISYFDLILKSLSKIINISEDQYSISEGIVSIRIINSIIENLSGKIDNYIPQFVELVTKEFDKDKSDWQYIQCLLQWLFNWFYYNPYLTISSLKSIGETHSLVEAWFSNFNQFKHPNIIRSVIIGTISLLNADVNQLPEEIVSQLNKIKGTEVSLFFV